MASAAPTSRAMYMYISVKELTFQSGHPTAHLERPASFSPLQSVG